MVLCDAVVELMSKLQRPYQFRVTVLGRPPFETKRIYEFLDMEPKAAAQRAMKLFETEMLHPSSILLATL
jgi:hypothetical protein